MDPTESQDSGYGTQASQQTIFSPRSPSPPSQSTIWLSPPSSQSLLTDQEIEEIPRTPISEPDNFEAGQSLIPLFTEEVNRSSQDQPSLSDSPYFRSPPIQYPDDPTCGDFFIQVENIVRSFPPDSFFLKWIRNNSNWYAHVILTDKNARAEIIRNIDSHFEIAPAIDAYLATRNGFCICPVTEDGSEASRYLNTSDG